VLLVAGYFIVLLAVMGSFVAMGGHMGALYQPFELALIGGAALGAFVAGNSKKSLALCVQSLPGVFKGVPYDKSLYMELMALLYLLLNKARREGMMALESHIEAPTESAIFADYPRIANDAKIMEFITDYLRIMISGNMSSFEIETLMDEDMMPSAASPTACLPLALWRRCWASSRRWPPSTSRRRCWAI